MEEHDKYIKFGSTEYKALKVNSIDDLKPGMVVYSTNKAYAYEVSIYLLKECLELAGPTTRKYKTEMYSYDNSRARVYQHKNFEVHFSVNDFKSGRYLFDQEIAAKIIDCFDKAIVIIQMQINAVRGLIEPILLDENKFPKY